MSPKKSFILLLASLLVVLGLTASGFYFAKTQLAKRALSLSQLKADVDAIDIRVQQAQTVLVQYEDLGFIESIAQDVLPPTKVQSNFIGEIYKIGNQADVVLRSITFTTPSGRQVTDPNLTQTTPLDGVSGVFVLSANITYETNAYAKFLNFLTNLEKNRRKLQISNLTINPIKEEIVGTNNSTRIVGYQGQLEVNVYVRP
ncbi:MAG TPA: hypothetical protein VGA08_02990 [Candidatus Saccharimonadales bacterium]